MTMFTTDRIGEPKGVMIYYIVSELYMNYITLHACSLLFVRQSETPKSLICFTIFGYVTYKSISITRRLAPEYMEVDRHSKPRLVYAYFS